MSTVDEMGEPEPLALVATGETSTNERTDTRHADASGTTLTVREAAERYDVSANTLRRLLAAGEIPGAYMKPSKAGDTWALPVASLVTMGYAERVAATAPVVEAVAPTVDTSRLTDLAASLAAIVDRDRLALQAAEQDRTEARAEAADAKARLELTAAALVSAEARAATLANELAELQAKRGRRWGRRRD